MNAVDDERRLVVCLDGLNSVADFVHFVDKSTPEGFVLAQVIRDDPIRLSRYEWLPNPVRNKMLLIFRRAQL
jgi:hypothetical protein